MLRTDRTDISPTARQMDEMVALNSGTEGKDLARMLALRRSSQYLKEVKCYENWGEYCVPWTLVSLSLGVDPMLACIGISRHRTLVY
ncbi:hypothetical protein A2U01_0006921 [Trifolium medium]|uniref:Uncharacterized protein n=1 Tax=Trifolium medium TaxID=97028 RepID=A0A392MEX1_9FABA|nr:hypothetical protein [Trifolium medium]